MHACRGANRVAVVGCACEHPVVLADLWPTLGLRLETPLLTLRIPNDDELAVLAEVAAGGVHRDGERPFLTPWTEGTPDERAEHVLRNHWGCLAEWSVDDWYLSMAVFASGTAQPLGAVTLRARDFPVTREVRTTSWLGLDHQGQGYGTEARTALLCLAFDYLGATDALTEVFQDNHASQGVSRRLGYQPDGISRDPRDGEVLVSDRLRLTSEQWASVDRVSVSVAGLDAARSMFG